MNNIKIPQQVWDIAKSHLFGSPGEHFAFFLTEHVKSADGSITLIIRDVQTIADTDVEDEGFAARLKLPALLNVINRANRENCVLVEIHNHNGGWDASFSSTDVHGFSEFVPYVLDSLPRRPYAALVLTPEDSVDGVIFSKDSTSDMPFRHSAISFLSIVGGSLEKMDTTASRKNLALKEGRPTSNGSSDAIHSRQILAFGKDGQRKIATTLVAIVGLGGLGSHVAQQLAYLGVRNFVFVDPDVVEESNLNRLIGASIKDVGDYKVNVAKRHIQLIAGSSVSIEKLDKDLRSKEALDALKHVDVIFGCVDTSGARLILNEMAVAFLVHYIDCATGMELDDIGQIAQAGGHVMVVKPTDGPCMLCASMIDKQEAANDLALPKELEDKKERGYISGVRLPDPSVVSLNGVVASLAVIEFQSLVTGLRPARTCTVYDLLAAGGPSVVEYAAKIDNNCMHHAYTSIGDRLALGRYLSQSSKGEAANQDG
jgi:molybdopterin/thiamine biosynthesis adenylyltransferase